MNATTVPNFVGLITSGDPAERKCRVFGCKGEGGVGRQLCEEHKYGGKAQNCSAQGCGKQAKGVLNVALTDYMEFKRCLQMKMNDKWEEKIEK